MPSSTPLVDPAHYHYLRAIIQLDRVCTKATSSILLHRLPELVNRHVQARPNPLPIDQARSVWMYAQAVAVASLAGSMSRPGVPIPRLLDAMEMAFLPVTQSDDLDVLSECAYQAVDAARKKIDAVAVPPMYNAAQLY